MLAVEHAHSTKLTARRLSIRRSFRQLTKGRQRSGHPFVGNGLEETTSLFARNARIRGFASRHAPILAATMRDPNECELRSAISGRVWVALRELAGDESAQPARAPQANARQRSNHRSGRARRFHWLRMILSPCREV